MVLCDVNDIRKARCDFFCVFPICEAAYAVDYHLSLIDLLVWRVQQQFLCISSCMEMNPSHLTSSPLVIEVFPLFANGRSLTRALRKCLSQRRTCRQRLVVFSMDTHSGDEGHIVAQHFQNKFVSIR